jgi:hypothetical protein
MLGVLHLQRKEPGSLLSKLETETWGEEKEGD